MGAMQEWISLHRLWKGSRPAFLKNAFKRRTLQKKTTKPQTIKELLAQQDTQPPGPDAHFLTETAGYLKCKKCGVNIHKRTNESAFTDFVNSKCVDQAYTQERQGHHTHALWQKGDKVTCTLCGVQWHLDSQKRVIATTAFRKESRGAGLKGSPPLSDYFKASQPAKEKDAPTDKRPTPRRLRFPTALDAQDQNEPDGEPTRAETAPAKKSSTEPSDEATEAGQAAKDEEDEAEMAWTFSKTS